MSNINKSFNFRNGVQVDNDNFVVNSNGLVGIGTSLPSEILDVRGGTVKVVGLITANDLYVSGFSTFTEVRLGTGIKMSSNSGIITATAFYGNGGALTNLPTSQWTDIDVGLGFTSIYNIGYVGVATNDPRYFFQVGGNPNTQSGVGFNSTGNIKATGIITAGYFSGIGASLTSLNATNITSGTIDNSYLPIINNDRFPPNITASNGFNGNLTGNVYSSGVSTFVSGIVGNVTGIASTARSLTGTPNISVGIVTASTIGVGFATAGIATVFTSLNVGISGTAFSALDSGRIGVGTALPTSEFQIRKSSATLLEVLSDTSQARISIGQSVGVGKSTATLRFGNTSKTFDIINNDTGNINTIIHGGPSGVGTGRFAWLYGQTNSELASLTYDGKFGIGITDPINTFHVVGTSTVTGNANFGGNVSISGNLNVLGSISYGSINFPSIITNTNLNNSAGISTFYNLNSEKIGIGALNDPFSIGVDINATGKSGVFGSIGIGTTSNQTLRVLGSTVLESVAIGNTSSDNGDGVAIFGGTTILNSNTVSGIKTTVVILDDTSVLGVGTTSYRSALDFGDAGKNHFGGIGAYMIVPRLSNTQRTGLSTVAGALIFNTNTSKFQGYTGIGWTDLH